MIRALHRFAQGLPFYYGWVILACVCCACLSRAGPAVATLSMFVTPMTTEFGWSRTEISGAVSLGGVLAAITSPMIGSYLDRSGPGSCLGLRCLHRRHADAPVADRIVLGFYLLYCVARMNWAGPYDLGIHGAVSNWFVVKRAWAASIAQLAQTTGLIVMPFVGFAHDRKLRLAHGLAGDRHHRAGGRVPPRLAADHATAEDIGQLPDGAAPAAMPAVGGHPTISIADPEPSYTRAEALKHGHSGRWHSSRR